MKLIASVLVLVAMISCGTPANENRLLTSNSQQKIIDSLTNVIHTNSGSSQEPVAEAKVVAKSPAEIQALVKQRNSVRTFVSAGKIKYKKVFLGGFKNIHYNLFNAYSYPLDQVSLTIHYIKANGNEVHSESQTVRNVPAHGSLALKAPDFTASGMSLRITIEAVSCKAIELCYNVNQPTFSTDPYKCK